MIIIFTNCKNATTEKNAINSSNSIIKEKIDTRLLSELNDYINKSETNENIIDFDAKCFIFEFIQDKKRVNFYAPPYEDFDPVVAIYYYKCSYNLNDFIGYRGTIKVDDYSIVIFDPDNIGEKFYDKNALEDIDFNMLKCIETKGPIMIKGLKIRGDSIAPWIFP